MRKDSRSNATPSPISAVIEAEGTGVGVMSGKLGKVRSKPNFNTGIPKTNKTSFSLARMSSSKNTISASANNVPEGLITSSSYLLLMMGTRFDTYSPTWPRRVKPSGRGKPPAVTFPEEIKGAGGRPWRTTDQQTIWILGRRQEPQRQSLPAPSCKVVETAWDLHQNNHKLSIVLVVSQLQNYFRNPTFS